MPLLNMPLLTGAVDDRDQTITDLRTKILTLERDLSIERSRNSGFDQGANQLRAALGPLYHALQMIFGQMDSMEINAMPSVSPEKNAVWSSWKAKLGGKAAEAVDALMLHGEMTAVQLRIYLGCANTHVYNVISQLNKAGIINKNGGKIALKSL